MSSSVEFCKDGHYCSLTLNREDRCHALDETMIEELDAMLSDIEADGQLRLVELTARGDRFFCAGGDIRAWSDYSPLDMGRKWIKRGNEVFNRLRNLPKLTVANINGHAIGGGLELALCCDIRIARRHACFSLPEVTLGMIPGWMGVERILTLVPHAIAREMVLLAKRLSAEAAAQAGLINAVVEPEDLPAWREARLQEVSRCAPAALAHGKLLINSIGDRHSELAHQLLAGLLAATSDCRNATAAFARRQAPLFTDN